MINLSSIMTLRQTHHTLIYNLLVCILIVTALIFSRNVAFGRDVEDLFGPPTLSSSEIRTVLKSADYCFDKSSKEKDPEEQARLLKMALSQYSVINTINKSDIYTIVQIARIYDKQKNDKLAKSYFMQALGINSRNISANYYLADYYYNRNNFRKAIEYYNKALDYGRGEDFITLCKMGVAYERLGDLRKANECYENAFLLKPQSELIPDKIRELEEIDYSNTGYYRKKK